jgi:hypothetical protein
MSASDKPKRNLALCKDHKQEWKQSEYAEHNCDYCKLERELAAANAKIAESEESRKFLREEVMRQIGYAQEANSTDFVGFGPVWKRASNLGGS